MDLKITKKEEKPLLAREECTAELNSRIVPSNAELKKAISEKMKKDESLILIKRINQKFGAHDLKVDFYVYSSADAIKKFERFRKPKAQPGAAK